MTREEMMEQLHARTCRVIFKKANGEERDMLCTLKSEVVPQSDTGESKDRKINENVIPAWDINAQGWRSFRVDSVISFS